MIDETEPLLNVAVDGEQDVEELGGCDIVQFSAPMYYVDELEAKITIDIMRLGPGNGDIAVHYFTEDGSALEGRHYKGGPGRVVFLDGDKTANITIPVLADGDWNPTREFSIKMRQPQNCHLGLYLDECRVKIINDDYFPTNEFKDDVAKGEAGVENIDDWGLFRGYCHLNYNRAGVKWQTWFVLAFDQLHGLVLFGTLWVGVYIVDTLFARGGSSSERLLMSDRFHTALLIALWYAVPNVVLYCLDVLKTYIDIKGASRKYLQASIMQSYLEYNTTSRDRVTSADVSVAIELGAEQIAAGYVAYLNMFGFIGKIVAVELFILFEKHEPLAMYSVLIMVTVLLIFNLVRVGVSQRAQKRVGEKLIVMASLTDEGGTKFRLVADYNKRSLTMDMFRMSVDEYNKERVPEALIRVSTQYATKIMSGLFIAIYIVAKTQAVLDNELSLGIFLATIAIFGTYLADAITDLNNQMMVIVDSFVPLKGFTTTLNLPSELPARRSINRDRRRRTTFLRNSPIATLGDSSAFFEDENALNIEVSNLTFERPAGLVLKNVSLTIPQGRMVSVIGPHNSGKCTFAEIIANILFPTSGSVYIPSHLRLLNVSREPMFLRTTMLHNLMLGTPSSHKIDHERLLSVLDLLGLKDMFESDGATFRGEHCRRGSEMNRVASLMRDEVEFLHEAAATWEQTLPHSRKVKLHIARALIANPEVMILQRPLQGLNDQVSTELLNVFRQHVAEKGVCLPEDGRDSRTLRTLFYVTENKAEAAEADIALYVDPDKKNVSEIAKNDL